MSRSDINLADSIVFRINKEDFVILHKYELESIMINADILSWEAELSEKLGGFVTGISVTLYFVPGTSVYIPIAFFLMGSYLMVKSFLARKARHKIIMRLFEEKLNPNQPEK